VVPGAPAAWSVAIVERYRNTTAAAAAARQQDADNLNLIPCGKHFTLEIEALDVNHNRWAAGWGLGHVGSGLEICAQVDTNRKVVRHVPTWTAVRARRFQGYTVAARLKMWRKCGTSATTGESARQGAADATACNTQDHHHVMLTWPLLLLLLLQVLLCRHGGAAPARGPGRARGPGGAADTGARQLGTEMGQHAAGRGGVPVQVVGRWATRARQAHCQVRLDEGLCSPDMRCELQDTTQTKAAGGSALQRHVSCW
jgi:hypothetical protein